MFKSCFLKQLKTIILKKDRYKIKFMLFYTFKYEKIIKYCKKAC